MLILVELPLYLALFLFLLETYGIEGAAAAWAVRAAAEGVVLLAVIRRLSPASVAALKRMGPAAAEGGRRARRRLPARGPGRQAHPIGVLLAAFALLAWYRILGAGERTRVLTRLRAARA